MNELTNLFNTLAFPVALCIILIWFLYKKVWSRIETTLDRVTQTNEELSKTNRILSEGVNKRLDDLDDKVNLLIK